jgi:undecaprenyl-diphosphatase
MDAGSALVAILLGIVEGLTEFVPVSSTGHLILASDLLGFSGPPNGVFEVVIQLGAILAVLWVYRERLLAVARNAGSDPAARRFVGNILLAFLPAAAVGAIAHDFIKGVLFSPVVVAVSLVLGGVAILVVERCLPAPETATVDEIRPRSAFKVGLYQILAMIPGVSRSGATIIGALLLRIDRRAATEFSFFLAIPTMLGAAVLDLGENLMVLDPRDALVIGVGFVTAFFAALVVVRTLVSFVSRHGFAPFAWYRIALGVAMLGFLLAQ